MKSEPTHAITYPRGLGAAVEAPRVGRIEPGETKDVALTEELAETYSAEDCVFVVAPIPKKKTRSAKKE